MSLSRVIENIKIVKQLKKQIKKETAIKERYKLVSRPVGYPYEPPVGTIVEGPLIPKSYVYFDDYLPGQDLIPITELKYDNDWVKLKENE